MTTRIQRLFQLAIVVALALFSHPLAAETSVAPPDVSPLDADTSGGAADVSDATGDVGSSDVADTMAPLDAGDATGMDAADVPSIDVGPDAAPDAVPGDVTVPDAGDTSSADMGLGDAVADGGRDAGDVSLVDVDAGGGVRFFGEVSVQAKRDDSGVTVTLERNEDGKTREKTTDREGRFAFEGLPRGVYTVTVSLEGYATIVEKNLNLDGDREARFTLFRDQEVQLLVRAMFDHVDEPPEDVEFELSGERDSLAPDAPIPVKDGVATWEVDTVPVGNWRLEAKASGFDTISYTFSAEGPERQAEKLDVRLFMNPANPDVPPPDTSGCSCGREDTGGSPAPTPRGPIGRIVFVFLSVLAGRRLTLLFASRRD